MTEYKKGDKVVLQLPKIGCSASGKKILMFNKNSFLGVPVSDDIVLGKLEEFLPAEEKIKMTVQEKEEFDLLKTQWVAVQAAISEIIDCRGTGFENVYKRLFHSSIEKNNEAQIEFMKAWENPSRIEVIEPDRYRVRIGFTTLCYVGGKWTFDKQKSVKLTLDEVKEAEKQLGIQGLQAKWHEAAKENGE